MKKFTEPKTPLIIGFGKGRGLEECSDFFHFPDKGMMKTLLDPKTTYAHDNVNNITCIKARHADLNWMLKRGYINVAVGSSVWFDEENDLFNEYVFKKEMAVPCRLSLISRKTIGIRNGLKIATKFPAITKNYLEQRKMKAEIIFMNGCHENALMLGFADAIIDIIETGRTLKKMGFVELDTLKHVSHKMYIQKSKPGLNILLHRLKKLVQFKTVNEKLYVDF